LVDCGFIFYDFRINPNGLAQPFLKGLSWNVE